METDKLDKILKDKLSSLEPNIPKDAWHSFEEKWNDADIKDNFTHDHIFDQTIFDKLNSFVFPAKEKHAWGHFYDYYSRVKNYENKVLWFKAMEVTLAFLAIFTFFQFDFNVENFRSIPIQPVVEIPKNLKSTVDEKKEKFNISDAVIYINPLFENSFSENIIEKTITEVEKIPSIPLSEIKSKVPKIHLNYFPNIEEIPSLTTLKIPNRAWKINLRPILDFGKWHFTLLGGLDGDNVHTPEYPRYKVPETIRNSTGFHLGFLLSEGTKRLETGFGLLFSNKEYNAPKITFIQGSLRDGYTGEQLKKIRLNILQIPVFTRYNVLQGEKWRMYASLGASAHLTLSANYFIVHPGFLPSSVLLTGKSNSVYQNLEEGLIQGGSILDNIFFTMDIGMGLEKQMSAKTSFFIQPNYQHFLGHINKGIGPYNDRISSLSIRAGIRINLFSSDK